MPVDGASAAAASIRRSGSGSSTERRRASTHAVDVLIAPVQQPDRRREGKAWDEGEVSAQAGFGHDALMAVATSAVGADRRSHP